MSGFYDAGPLRQAAINLFQGWGYNFYRRENQLRADDQLVRAKACAFLNEARAVVDVAEQAYRREHLPPPSRANPRPDPDAIQVAQTLEGLSREIGALEAQIRSQPVPENDRMTERRRNEGQTLEQLSECDQTLIGQCDLLHTLVTRPDDGEHKTLSSITRDGVAAIKETLRRRAAILL